MGTVTFSVELNDGRIQRSHRQNSNVLEVSISQEQTEATPPVSPGLEEHCEEVVNSTTRDLDSLEEVKILLTTHVH